MTPSQKKHLASLGEAYRKTVNAREHWLMADIKDASADEATQKLYRDEQSKLMVEVACLLMAFGEDDEAGDAITEARS